MSEAVEKLVKKSEDPSRWYLQLVRMAKLAEGLGWSRLNHQK